MPQCAGAAAHKIGRRRQRRVCAAAARAAAGTRARLELLLALVLVVVVRIVGQYTFRCTLQCCLGFGVGARWRLNVRIAIEKCAPIDLLVRLEHLL